MLPSDQVHVAAQVRVIQRLEQLKLAQDLNGARSQRESVRAALVVGEAGRTERRGAQLRRPQPPHTRHLPRRKSKRNTVSALRHLRR